MSKLASTNPSKNYAVIGEVALSTAADVAAKVAAARAAQPAWRALGVQGRAECLRRAIARLDRERENLARLMSQEMGMPIRESREDLASGIAFLNSYIEAGAEYLRPEVTFQDDHEIDEVYHEPYGVAAVIVPWNFPFSNFVWQCGENLVAGNTIVFKHSEETPLFGQALETRLTAELPAGVFNEVYGDGAVGELLINEKVDLICFTGSAKTGQHINALAAPRFIPTLFELGGSAPGIVFEDTDVESVAETIIMNRFINCGQMCDALKRLIVHESLFDAVVAKLQKLLETKRIGDAEDELTDIGPLVARRQLELLEAQMADAVQKGARVVVGGKRPSELAGAYYEPTLLANIKPDMRVWQEEVFGPVLPIVTFKTEAEAIQLANDTPYGLGAYIFTADNERFARVAAQVESGMVSQNNLGYVKTCNPFGGYKLSGGGREHARFGLSEVTQVKVVARQR